MLEFYSTSYEILEKEVLELSNSILFNDDQCYVYYPKITDLLTKA